MNGADIAPFGRSKSGMQDLQNTPNSTRHLDGLRIVAAVAVVVLHYSDYVKDMPLGRFLVEHTQHFNLFVDLFFVISGFVIASQYATHVESPASVCRFLWRRIARIYPLHLATLAFYVMIALTIYFGFATTDNPARYPFSDLPAQLLLFHAFDGDRLTFNFPSWSLSAEMFCYVLFPLSVLIVTRNKAAIIALVVLPIIGNSLYAATTGTAPWADWINKGGAFRAVPGFNLGIACYLFRDRITRLPSLPGLLTVSLALFLVLGSLLSAMAALVAVYIIAILAIQNDCAGDETLFSRLRFDRWSSLTYSVYMLHIPVATVVLSLAARPLAPLIPGGKLTLVPVALSVLAVASIISLRMFETPVRRYLNGLYDRHFCAPTAASTASGRNAS